jgi:hypothetical protein
MFCTSSIDAVASEADPRYAGLTGARLFNAGRD